MFGGLKKGQGKKGTTAFKINAACMCMLARAFATAVEPASINDT
jgi:hypothetical protein